MNNHCEDKITIVKYRYMEEEPDDSKPSQRLTPP